MSRSTWFLPFALLVFVPGCAPRQVSDVVTGEGTKLASTAHFVAGRPRGTVLRDEMFLGTKLARFVKPTWGDGVLTCKGLGSHQRTAVLRKNLGCTLLPVGATTLTTPDHLDLPEPPSQEQLPPCTSVPAQVRHDLNAVFAWAFDDHESWRPWRTRAAVVVLGGQVLAERYASTYTWKSKLLGWSMTKSVINAMVGILVRQGKLQLDSPVAAPEWPPGDPRSSLTFEQLLRMSSGLDFEESPVPFDLAGMLFLQEDMAAYAAARRLEPRPRWYYSSGTTLIVSRALRRVIGGPVEDYLRFPYQELFYPIEMASPVFETDASNTFVGSSYVWATAQDWARFGMLYCDDGCWHGRRILPEGWVRKTWGSTAGSNQGEYGLHFWTNAGGRWPDLPRDLLLCVGFEGQLVAIVPSRRMVIVRLGHASIVSTWDSQEFIRRVLAAVPWHDGLDLAPWLNSGSPPPPWTPPGS